MRCRICTKLFVSVFAFFILLKFTFFRRNCNNENTVANSRLLFQLPDPSQVQLYMEPYVLGTIVFPEECMGKMLSLCEVRSVKDSLH